MKQLISTSISEPWQVEVMRHIYNENLETLASKPIPFQTYENQQAWWHSNKHKLKGYLYEPIDRPGKFVAFLILTDRGGFFTPIIAVQKEEWKKGYGKLLVEDYVKKANGPLAATQLQSNTAICYLNKNIGFHVLGEGEQPNGKVELIYHPGINPEQKMTAHIFDAILDYLNIDKKIYYSMNPQKIKEFT